MTTAAKAKKQKKVSMATAMHGTDGINHVVGLGNIKVIICPDDDCWFAQGLDIDYGASGETIEKAKENFQDGLKGTIDLHIRMHGNIEHFLKVAPKSAWKEMYEAGSRFRYSQLTFHEDLFKDFPFQGINYIEPGIEALA